MTACPPADSLAAILTGTVPAGDLSTLDDHLADCPTCQNTLQQLSDAPRLTAWMSGEPPSDSGLSRVGRYRVGGPIGRGGMGVVYRATDEELHRPVALKVLRSGRTDPDDVARFVREARSAAGLRHDHLVPVLGIERTTDGHPVIVMPLVRGPSLKDRMRADQPPTPAESAEWIRQVADGLAAVHAAGLVHRDVKPGNVLLDADDGRAKLTDFGLARAADPAEALTRDGVLAGTPEYLSPEQASRPADADPRSDVYSLGVTLYECLTGVVPFRGPPLDVLTRHRTEEPVDPRRLNSRVPADLVTVCLKCVEKDPARRYPSAAAVRDDLGRFLAGRPILARPAGRAERAWRWTRRNPLPVAVVAVSVIGFAASAAGWWRAGVKATEAETNAETARNREADATAARALADERSRLALAAITTLVTKAQNLMGDAPGTLKLKQQLNEAALADLHTLSEATEMVPGADRTTLLARLKLGDTFQLLGRTDDAVKEWTRAASLAGQLVARDADDLLSRRDLARAHYNLGFVANRMTNFVDADKHMGLAVETLEDARRRAPEDLLVLDNLGVAYNGRADVAWMTNRSENALADYERSVDLNTRILDRTPDNADVRSKLFYTVGRIGYVRIGLQHDYPAAEAVFRDQIRIATGQLAKTPNDRTWRRNLHISQLDLSSALQRQGDATGAEKAARDALAWLEPTAAADPDNVQVQRDASSGFTHLALALIVAGRYADAEAAYARSYNILLPFANRSATASYITYDLPPLTYSLAVATWRQGRYDDAAKWLDRTIEHYGKLTGNNPTQTRTVVGNIRTARTAFARTQQALDDPDYAFAQPADVAPLLSSLRAVTLAVRGDDAAARAEWTRLRERFPGGVAVLFCQASLDGFAAGRCNDPAEKRRLVASGGAALLAAITADRSLLDTIHLLPELIPIRTDPAYRAGLTALIATADH